MEKNADLYTPLVGSDKQASKNTKPVKSFVGEFITDSTAAESTMKQMRPIFLHGISMTAKKEKPKRHPRNRPLNARERRELKVYDLNPAAIKYNNFVPLHQLWEGYMKDLLEHAAQDPQQFAQRLLKADFHGSILTVTKSKNPLYVGSTGIMIQETMNVFSIVTKDDKMKKIPKTGSIFLLSTNACKESFTLYGNQLQFRAAERAVRKFKVKPTIDL
ncbi:unnamed protein product [Absidia cylindrospora]